MNNNEVHIQPRIIEPLTVGNNIFKSAYDWELEDKDLEKARCELGEIEGKLEECLQKLKNKLTSK